MDPDKTLREFRAHMVVARLPGTSVEERNHQLALAATAMEALDKWISNGGYPPREWAHTRNVATNVTGTVVQAGDVYGGIQL